MRRFKMLIEDGTGRGYNAKVSQFNMLQVVAVNRTQIANASFINGDAYSLCFSQASAGGANDPILYIKNLDDKALILSQMWITCSAADVLYFKMGVIGTAAGGTAPVPVNLNTSSAKLANVTTHMHTAITGLTLGTTAFKAYFTANAISQQLLFNDAFILAKQGTWALFVTTAAANTVQGQLLFYFQDTD